MGLCLGMKYNLFGSSLCCVAWISLSLAPLPLANLCSRKLIPLPLASSDTHNLYDSQQKVDVTTRRPSAHSTNLT